MTQPILSETAGSDLPRRGRRLWWRRLRRRQTSGSFSDGSWRPKGAADGGDRHARSSPKSFWIRARQAAGGGRDRWLVIDGGLVRARGSHVNRHAFAFGEQSRAERKQRWLVRSRRLIRTWTLDFSARERVIVPGLL